MFIPLSCHSHIENFSHVTHFLNFSPDFRICVESQQDTFSVSAFLSVECSNGDQSRNLVLDGTADAVTRLELAPDADGVLALTSLVLPVFLEGPNAVMKCSGQVAVESASGTTRTLRKLLFGSNARTLQDAVGAPAPEETDAVFSLGIQLDTDPYSGNNRIGGIGESSAFPASGVFLALSMTAVTATAHAFFV